MWYVSHKLRTDVKGSVLKYHTDPMIRLADICEKHRLSAAEMNSNINGTIASPHCFYMKRCTVANCTKCPPDRNDHTAVNSPSF